jgi:hypothetical protein
LMFGVSYVVVFSLLSSSAYGASSTDGKYPAYIV